ncbi:MAG: GNAT family N-acetyltransferase [Lachnospiraceae bacterium]|nr:GNAT family N-acetyltransferase [Lachnospiraceae bacterium]
MIGIFRENDKGNLTGSVKSEFTVNSSPYAVDVYRHLGFASIDKEQTVNA